ncbi:MAG: dephospho-CoA kinase [Verrucomicrobia bacterium]|nr:dephospho-CoA kinase [Verrucomicrobiota bacterium]MDE3099218.1 dephospho-CoA kinase [Verrucomicrobiota bacterium]
MKLCGLTGGVGMGKSTAARFLRGRNVPVADTDEIARELVRPGQPALAQIQAAFGPEILQPNGELSRAKLAGIVFANAAARQKLEAILHPPIRQRWLDQAAAWRAQNVPLAVVVIPLLFETNAAGRFDKIICAACSSAAQTRRLLERGWTMDHIRRRVAAQWPVEDKIARSDFVIWTEGALENHSAQLDRILARLAS